MFIAESTLLIMKLCLFIHRKTTNFFNGEHATCVLDYNEYDHIWTFLLNLDNKQACTDLISSFE